MVISVWAIHLRKLDWVVFEGPFQLGIFCEITPYLSCICFAPGAQL